MLLPTRRYKLHAHQVALVISHRTGKLRSSC
uniref:Uncharacterized protein n=1 Tax=Arundo donax TaxID=35708 RepID=A0A0A9GZ55_ARUDO